MKILYCVVIVSFFLPASSCSDVSKSEEQRIYKPVYSNDIECKVETKDTIINMDDKILDN